TRTRVEVGQPLYGSGSGFPDAVDETPFSGRILDNPLYDDVRPPAEIHRRSGTALEPIRLIRTETIRDLRLQEWLVGMIVLRHSFGAGNPEDCRIRGCRPRRDRENSSTCRWNMAGC